MLLRSSENSGRVLTIEHLTDSIPALMVFSGNAGQLLRGDIPTANILKAMKQRIQRNAVSFTIHLQEAGTINKASVGMTRLIEDIFGDDVVIYSYGSQETNGQIRDGMDQYIISSKDLTIRTRSVIHLPVVNRKLLRKNQRVAVNTSYDFAFPDGESGYLETTGFHYDLGLTPNSTKISRLQAVETRRGVDDHLQQDICQNPSLVGLKGLITFSGDGNTRGFVGSRWHTDRIDALKKGLGDDMQEATAEIDVTANLPHSIQQEFIGKESTLLKLTGNIIDSAIDAVDIATGSKWGERKLDHQFYRDFTLTSAGTFAPLNRFDVIENNVFYNFLNADHYFISTLFGYQTHVD